MEHTHCLNCGSDLTGKFCSNCGQKSDTHRITLKHLIFHDIIHGTFHFEKGMLFTAKQTLLRPGKAALDYISGKRVNYYNIFYFILILIGLIALSYNYFLLEDVDNESSADINFAGQKFKNFFSTYGKFFIFLTVPFTAINSFFIFRRKKLNFSEHIIISGMLLLGFFLIITLFFILGLLFSVAKTVLPPIFFKYILFSLPYFVLFYIIYTYFNAFKEDYTVLGFSYRIFFFIVLLFLEILLFFLLLVGFATNWEGGEMMFTI